MKKLHTIVFASTFTCFSILSPVFAATDAMVIESAVIESVNINKADENTLATLKGIGIKKAQAIIEFRSRNGKFQSIDELLNVKGIGEHVLLANKQRIII